MKKWGLLILILFFATGCDAEYNLTINKATIIEDLQIYEEDTNKWNDSNNLFSISYKDAIENNLNYKLGVFFDEQLEDFVSDNPNYIFYNPKKIKEKNKLGINYKYRFSIENYDRAYFPKNCFDNIKVYDERGYITISTSKGFNCLGDDIGLSNLTINIKTKYEVESSNADSKNGQTYSWKINKQNASSKSVYINVDTRKIAKQDKDAKLEQKLIDALLTIGLTIAILLIIVIIFLVNKKKKLENY